MLIPGAGIGPNLSTSILLFSKINLDPKEPGHLTIAFKKLESKSWHLLTDNDTPQKINIIISIT